MLALFSRSDPANGLKVWNLLIASPGYRSSGDRFVSAYHGPYGWHSRTERPTLVGNRTQLLVRQCNLSALVTSPDFPRDVHRKMDKMLLISSTFSTKPRKYLQIFAATSCRRTIILNSRLCPSLESMKRWATPLARRSTSHRKTI